MYTLILFITTIQSVDWTTGLTFNNYLIWCHAERSPIASGGATGPVDPVLTGPEIIGGQSFPLLYDMCLLKAPPHW